MCAQSIFGILARTKIPVVILAASRAGMSPAISEAICKTLAPVDLRT